MKSLNQRILFSASLVLLVFIIGTAATLDRAFYDSARAGVRDRMLGQLYLLMGNAEVDSKGALSMPLELPDADLNRPDSGTYAFITNKNGIIAWQSASTLNVQMPSPVLMAKGMKKFDQVKLDNNKPFFIYSFGITWSTESGTYPLTFNVVTNTNSFDAQIGSYRKNLWGWLGLMALLLLIAQALVLRWGLRPVRQVSSELSAIESGQQNNIQGDYPRELKLLTDNINSLVNHERKHQKRYRNALDDLAHSLKTPLTVLRGAIEIEDDELKKKHTINEQISRMDNIVQYQLRRAATAGSSPGTRQLTLRPIVDKIVNTLNKAHHNKAPVMNIDVDAKLRLRIDAGDLMELLGNLLDNAFKWCHKTVSISAKSGQDTIIIRVEDDGPGIQTVEIERILERGVRAGQATPGHGIGLAIVRDIVQAYDGTLSIGKSTMGGAMVTIKLSSY